MVVGLVDAIIIGTSASLMIGLEYLVFRTKLGTAMRAVSFDCDAAALMGVPVDRVISFTFVLGSSLAAAAGFLYALKYPGLNQPAHSTWVLLGLKAFVAAVIGGIGNVRGAVLGGFVIASVEQFGSFYISPNYRDVYVFALLIAILLVQPSGCSARLCRKRCSHVEPFTGCSHRQNRGSFSRRFRRRVWCSIASGRWLRGSRLAVVLHFTVPNVLGTYPTKITIDCGIAIILAVSLNIVNGMTGQFSLGHAAFMALGGYAAGAVTYYGSMLLWGTPASTAAFWGRANGCFWSRALSAGSWPRWPDMSWACRRFV